MEILADENLDGPIVSWLRESGHDVRWIAEQVHGAIDKEVVELANSEGRVLITSDRDFGELVFRHGMRPPGVVLLRLRANSASALLSAFQKAWPTIEKNALGKFVVVSRGRVRTRLIA